MAFKAHKEFFDASAFLGMHSADDGVRKACKRFFALRFRGVALTSLDQVGKCDDVIWRRPRHLQDAYYPFMGRLHSEMRIVREPFSEEELKRAVADPRLQRLPVGDRLLLAEVIEATNWRLQEVTVNRLDEESYTFIMGVVRCSAEK